MKYINLLMIVISMFICVLFVVFTTGTAFLVGYIDSYNIGVNVLEVDFNMIFQFFLKGFLSFKGNKVAIQITKAIRSKVCITTTVDKTLLFLIAYNGTKSLMIIKNKYIKEFLCLNN